MLDEEKSMVAKLSNDINEMKKKLKKSEARCEQLVIQVENLTIAHTKALSETTRMTTLADSLQILLDTKKKELGNQIEERHECENEHDENIQSSKRKFKCRYWNNGFCSKGDQCVWYHPEEDCPEYLQGEKCTKRHCNKRHRKVCRYWLKKNQGCRRGVNCQYLHQKVKEPYQTEKVNSKEIDNTTKSFKYINREYEKETHIDTEVPFEEIIKQAVVKILREMKYKEENSEETDEENYEYEESDDEE